MSLAWVDFRAGALTAFQNGGQGLQAVRGGHQVGPLDLSGPGGFQADGGGDHAEVPYLPGSSGLNARTSVG